MAALVAALKKFDTLVLIILTSLVAVDGYLWLLIFSASGVAPTSASTHEYFLDVGQGDSELVVFPSGAKIMTDAGPKAGQTSAVIDALEKVLPQNDRYIDIAIISHPDSDHFAGYLDILDRYEIGAFIYNGRDGASDAWQQLMEKIDAKRIPLVTLGAGDRIHCGTNVIDILSPDGAFAQSAETNDTSLVELVRADPGGTDAFRTLLTGDAPFSVENYLLKNGVDVRADILKVAHHGSKYASGSAFLRTVDPKAAVIGVGAKNVYGHPSKEALSRLASSTYAQVFRTDLDGTVEIFSENGMLKAVKEKQTTPENGGK
ncbi:MAG: hypothetical protein ABSE18_02245 [Minisyncoccia bacterium]|jgi:beta-lactamase superfamily II metal-dependent hydrolase